MIIKLCKRRHRISIVVDSTYHGHHIINEGSSIQYLKTRDDSS